MKRLILIAGLLTAGVMATDFSAMTMDKLNAARNTIAVEDKVAFLAEVKKRLQVMTPEERVKFEISKDVDLMEPKKEQKRIPHKSLLITLVVNKAFTIKYPRLTII